MIAVGILLGCEGKHSVALPLNYDNHHWRKTIKKADGDGLIEMSPMYDTHKMKYRKYTKYSWTPH